MTRNWGHEPCDKKVRGSYLRKKVRGSYLRKKVRGQYLRKREARTSEGKVSSIAIARREAPVVWKQMI